MLNLKKSINQIRTTLAHATYVIQNYSADEYAKMLLEDEKKNYVVLTYNTATNEEKESKPEYEEYMKLYWGKGNNTTLEQAIDNSYRSKLKEYVKLVKYCTGFKENGEQFVLNNKEHFVSFVWKDRHPIMKDFAGNEIGSIELITNYNPANVDAIGDSIPVAIFDKMVASGELIVSTDEDMLNKMCDELIAQQND